MTAHEESERRRERDGEIKTTINEPPTMLLSYFGVFACMLYNSPGIITFFLELFDQNIGIYIIIATAACRFAFLCAHHPISMINAFRAASAPLSKHPGQTERVPLTTQPHEDSLHRRPFDPQWKPTAHNNRPPIRVGIFPFYVETSLLSDGSLTFKSLINMITLVNFFTSSLSPAAPRARAL